MPIDRHSAFFSVCRTIHIRYALCFGGPPPRRTNLRPVIPCPLIIAFSERLRISPVAFLGIFHQRVGDRIGGDDDRWRPN